ncbi:MAG TPA: hypothetical protein DCG75_03075 [Bacteroidales bacterium]|nr:hypothetical protein [Bacteroidales bacterium]
MTTEKRNDEIDLIELFLNIYIFFKKNFWFLFISVIIGAGLGYSTKFLTKKHYESSMLINSYTVSGNLLMEYINNIQSILEDGNLKYLSERMEMDTIQLASLKEITIEDVYDEKEKKSKGYLSVSVNVLDNNILSVLDDGILKYIEKEPFVQSEIEIFTENNLNIISKIDEEIEKIEELQQLSLSQDQNKGDVNIYNSQKSFQNELLDLLKEKQNREKYLKFAIPYRVIQDFTIYQKPKTKTKTYTLISGFLFGFIAFSFLIIKNINKSLKEK